LLIPYYQFRSKSIVQYSHYHSEGRFIRTERQKISAQKLTEQETYSGCLCPGAKKRLGKALENLIQFAKPKEIVRKNGHRIKFSVNFITLTIHNFGQFVPAKEAHKQVFEAFLRWCRETQNVTMYLWKAELQAKREDVTQLHYHLTTDTYIDKDELEAKWNDLQRRAGYLENFYTRFGHYNPPSTKVHALYKKRDPVAYIKKEILNYADFVETHVNKLIEPAIELADNGYYNPEIIAEITKEVQNKFTVGGKVWDCSLNLKKIKPHEEIAEGEVYANLQKEVSKGNVSPVFTDHCTIYKFRKGYTWQILPRQQRRDYFKKADELLSYERQRIKKPPEREPVFTIKRVINFYANSTLFSTS
jgi:hypothetical protein